MKNVLYFIMFIRGQYHVERNGIMPRKSRKNQKTIVKTYHVMIRGVNRQSIFWDDLDKKKFIKESVKTKEKYHYQIYGYVLMSNHVHIIIYDIEEGLSNIIHDICMNYAIYFNRKYERTGHLFQNRFKSKQVEKQNYLLNLVRYIHKNPIDDYDVYLWSSYKEYVDKPIITDVEFVLDMFSKNNIESIRKFIEFHKLDMNKDEKYEFEFEKKKITDNEARKEINKICNIEEVTNKSKQEKRTYIREILRIEGINIMQISRILGIDRKFIERTRNLYKDDH